MNMRLFTATLAAITAGALGACTVESSGSTSTSTTTTTTTTGGSGGATSSGDTATGTGGGAGGAATSTTGNGSGGEAACDPAYTCAEAITPSTGNPAELCDNDAKALYTALSMCTCSGACAAACKDSACLDNDPSTSCKICLANSTTGCGKELKACTDGG
jgi:hypothetical protein